MAFVYLDDVICKQAMRLLVDGSRCFGTRVLLKRSNRDIASVVHSPGS